MRKLLIIGAGGHGKVVADTAREIGSWAVIAFLDDYQEGRILEWPVLGRSELVSELNNEFTDLAVAFGDNRKRLELLHYYAELGYNLPAIIHPTAFISKSASIGAGTVAFAQTAVNAGTKMGLGCIINTGATVDHDCLLADAVHLSPGVHLGGEVRIGRNSWLGVGASVINRVTIGENVIIGAGSVIIEQAQDNVTVVGNPGRVVKKNG